MTSPDNRHAELWQKLTEHGWSVGNMPASSEHAVWFVRVLIGFAAWCASFFLIGFFLVAFDVWDNQLAALITGCFVVGAAVLAFSAAGDTDFVRQAALAFSLCGQMLIGLALLQYFDSSLIAVTLSMATLQIVLIIVVADFSHRLMCTLFVAVALTIATIDIGLDGIQIIALATVFVLIWRTDVNWRNRRALLEPVGVGLGVSLLLLASYLASDSSYLYWNTTVVWAQWFAIIPWLLPVAWTILTLLVINDVLETMDEALHSTRSRWLLFSGVIVAAVSFAMPGAGIALLVLIAAFAKQRPILFLLAALSFIGLAISYYYTLQITLLNKSLLLMATGVVLLVGYFIANRMAGVPPSNTLAALRAPRNSQRWVVGLVAVALLLVAADIIRKERLLANGAYVLLELAPVDPRAPMQGDFMRLRYAIADLVRNESFIDDNQNGYIVLALDANRVARYERLTDTLPNLTNNQQIAIRYRSRSGVLRLASNAFFFQEGMAEHYQNARYGEFRVDTNGEMILNALRDGNYESLALNRP